MFGRHSRSRLDVFNEPRQHLVRVEPLLGDVPGCQAMPLVVGCNALRTPDRFVERLESQKPFTDGDRAAETGVLDQSWLT